MHQSQLCAEILPGRRRPQQCAHPGRSLRADIAHLHVTHREHRYGVTIMFVLRFRDKPHGSPGSHRRISNWRFEPSAFGCGAPTTASDIAGIEVNLGGSRSAEYAGDPANDVKVRALRDLRRHRRVVRH